MRIVGLLAAVAAVAALLTGCGGGDDGSAAATVPALERGGGSGGDKDLREVWVSLNGHVGAETAGILMAERRGYFRDRGLSVGIGTPLTPARTVGYVANRTATFGVAQQPQVVLARAKGTRVVAVGSLLSRPTAAMIWLRDSQIGGIEDLKGKTLAVTGLPYQEEFLRVLLRRGGLTLADVEIERVGYELVSALVKGRADAAFGGSANVEGARLEARGLEPVVMPVSDFGVPAYDELILITRSDRASEEPRLVRDFMAAVVRGTAAAVENPAEVTEAIEENVESTPFLSREAVQAQVEATLPLLSETGFLSPGRASRLASWMRAEGLIRREPAISELLTNEYLPPRP